MLATGQRTLITAKTPRALQVLEGLVPNELRPLCINLLGSGPEERRSLESSVGGILRKNEEWKEDRATRERAELEESLRKLREEKARVDRRLRDIRESETHTQSIAEGFYRGTAARIAEAVSRDRAAYEWFLDPVPLEKACQISTSDLRNVLKILRRFTLEKRREFDLVWPNALLTSESFAGLVKSEISAIEELQASTGGADEHLADLLARNNISIIEAIRDALSTFRDARKRLMAIPHSWMNDAVRDILGGNSTLWHELLRVTRYAITSVEEHVAVADDTMIEFPDTCDVRVLCEDARKLKEHLDNGGKLDWGVFRPKPIKERIYVIKFVKIGGRPCLTAEHFATLANVLHVRIECEKAWDFWIGRSDKVQGPYALQLTTLKSLRNALESVLSLEGIISNCREAIQKCPTIEAPVWADESRVESITLSCRLALARIRRRVAAEEIQRIETPVSFIAAKSNAHPVTKELLIAIHDRNVDGFAQSSNKIQDLEKEHLRLRKVEDYLKKLRHLLPRFADCLEATCNEPYWEERIQRIGDAWHWAQARYWIEDYIRQEDVPALAKRAKQIEDEINSIIAKLASLHVWSFCFSRLKEDHRRNMKAWQKNVSKITKSGTGKQDSFHRREAQKNLNNCREAIPAWVMPLHRVWDTHGRSPTRHV